MIRNKIIIVEDDPGISKYLRRRCAATITSPCSRPTARRRWR